MDNIDDLRDSLIANQSSSGVPFWIPVVAIIAVGALGGLAMASFNQPKPGVPSLILAEANPDGEQALSVGDDSSIPLELRTFPTVTANLNRRRKPINDLAEANKGFSNEDPFLNGDDKRFRKQIEKASGDKKIFDRATAISLYASTVNRAWSCMGLKNFDQMKQISANYEKKNKANMEAWRSGVKRSKFSEKMRSGNLTKSEVLVAGVTGQIRRSAANDMMENMAMMGGLSSQRATPQVCSKLRADMQMGELDIAPPPSN